LYRKTVQSVPFINTNPEAVIRELQLRDEAEWELFQALYAAATRWFPRQEDTANCGYAVKDLNGDGVAVTRKKGFPIKIGRGFPLPIRVYMGSYENVSPPSRAYINPIAKVFGVLIRISDRMLASWARVLPQSPRDSSLPEGA